MTVGSKSRRIDSLGSRSSRKVKLAREFPGIGRAPSEAGQIRSGDPRIIAQVARLP